MYIIFINGRPHKIDKIIIHDECVIKEDAPYYGQRFKNVDFYKDGKLCFSHLIEYHYAKKLSKKKNISFDLNEHDKEWD